MMIPPPSTLFDHSSTRQPTHWNRSFDINVICIGVPTVVAVAAVVAGATTLISMTTMHPSPPTPYRQIIDITAIGYQVESKSWGNTPIMPGGIRWYALQLEGGWQWYRLLSVRMILKMMKS